MNKRIYNVFFHLHTVSSIVISIGLYIIFFAGAFALFHHEIHHWEEGSVEEEGGYGAESEKIPLVQLDFDHIMSLVEEQGFTLNAKDIHFYPLDGKYRVYLSPSRDSLATDLDKQRHYLLYDAETGVLSESKINAPGQYSIGSLLFGLHFFNQLQKPGYYLAGLVSLFFLFVIVSGIVIHWNKIIQNFYLFRPFSKLKTVWTDAHTALATIGIPFQFMYALTGAVFCLGVLVTVPSTEVLYQGDQQKYAADIFGREEGEWSDNKADFSKVSLNQLIQNADTRWDNFKLNHIKLLNYGFSNAVFIAEGKINTWTILNESGNIIYDPLNETVLSEDNPNEPAYTSNVRTVMNKLHYAEYGELGEVNNILLRSAYFLLTLITCFVIISGVMIWLEARNKRNIPEKKRKFNEAVGHIYLAICLTMLPITAFSFIVSKLMPEQWVDYSRTILNAVFFGGWLLLSLFFWHKKDNYFTNKYTLLSGGIFSLLIPLVSGLASGTWLWTTFLQQHYDIFVIDALWILLAFMSFYIVSIMKNPSVSEKMVKS